VTDPGNRRIKASDLEVGAVAQVLPEIEDPEHRHLSDIAKDADSLSRVGAEALSVCERFKDQTIFIST